MPARGRRGAGLQTSSTETTTNVQHRDDNDTCSPAPGPHVSVPCNISTALIGAAQHPDSTYQCRPAPGRHVYVSRPAKHVSAHIACVLYIRCVLNVERSALLQVLEVQSICHHIHTHTRVWASCQQERQKQGSLPRSTCRIPEITKQGVELYVTYRVELYVTYNNNYM